MEITHELQNSKQDGVIVRALVAAINAQVNNAAMYIFIAYR